jgi:alanine racemase
MSMAEAFVDLGAIAHNTALLTRTVGGAGVLAVVKADGFGHGAVPVARTALAHGATWLGVTSPAEALELRAAGLTAPALLWMYPPDESFVDLLHARVDISISSVAALEAVAAAADRTGLVAQVHLKADTGMSRGGALADDWPQLVTWARKFELAGLLRIRGIWSHLANADTPGADGPERQLRVFDAARRTAENAGIAAPITHLANSAAALHLPRTRLDLVRIGLALYGVEPVPGRTSGLRPALTVRARILLTKRVPAGTGVSYGPDHVTDRETTLALVPLGFADGVPRQSAGRAHVAVHGVRCPVVGRISMDQIVVDVGDLRTHPGDIAVMFGPGTDGEPTAAEWAEWAGTNPNDILTGIGRRVPRVYGPVR